MLDTIQDVIDSWKTITLEAINQKHQNLTLCFSNPAQSGIGVWTCQIKVAKTKLHWIDCRKKNWGVHP